MDALPMVEQNTYQLELAVAERNAWNTSKSIGLYTNTTTPTPNMAAGDFTPATYDGYAPLPLSFGLVYVDPAGLLTFVDELQFNSVPIGNPAEIVLGVYVFDVAGVPLAAANLQTPISMGLSGQSTNIVVQNKGGQMSLGELPI